MQLKCYVTGKTGAVELYSFGAQITLPLEQEVFAKFILRAGEDETHQKIMDETKVLSEELQAKKDLAVNAVKDFCDGLKNENDIVDVQFAFRELDYKICSLMLEKAKSGVRILNEIKKEYED